MNIGSIWHKWDLHVHTPSSYDVKNTTDYNKNLVKQWKENNISAVAITDHWNIDPKRIENIRNIIKEKGYKITVFPGVELRTDKGSPNIHLIGIFPENCNLKVLHEDFEIFKRDNAHPQNFDDKTIYFDFDKICEFVHKKSNCGLLSVHDGRKSNGVDNVSDLRFKTNDIDRFEKLAIKEEFRKSVDFLDTNSNKSALELLKILKRTSINNIPVTINSDVHNPGDYPKHELTWIKSELTFNGLKEAFSQPSDRIEIATQPNQLRNQQLMKYQIISKLQIKSNGSMSNWYGNNIEIPINPGLVAIIGNKGSGKSAISDVIGLSGNSDHLKYASFLNKDRFNNSKHYGTNFSSLLQWADGSKSRWYKLNESITSGMPKVEYLPQRYIEKVASAVDDTTLREEIDKILFNALPLNVRKENKTWNQFVQKENKDVDKKLIFLRKQLSSVNEKIVDLQNKLAPSNYDKNNALLVDLRKQDESLKKISLRKPVISDKNTDLKKQWDEIRDKKKEKQNEVNNLIEVQTQVKNTKRCFQELINQREDIEHKIFSFNKKVQTFNFSSSSSNSKKLNIDFLMFDCASLDVKEKEKIQAIIDSSITEYDKKISQIRKEISKLNDQIKTKEKAMSKMDKDQAAYEIEKKDLEEKLVLIEKGNGDSSQESIDSLEKYFDFVKKDAQSDLMELFDTRKSILRNIYKLLKEKVEKDNNIYDNLKGNIEDENSDGSVKFQASFNISNSFIQKIISYADTRKNGKLHGRSAAIKYIEQEIQQTDISQVESLIPFTEEITYQTIISKDSINNITKFVDNSNVFKDTVSVYNYVYGLDFLDIQFRLEYRNVPLKELSAGEKGLLLLIFYLGMSNNESPLIIDQPEDNLDNQSIFEQLVPYLKRAKQKRQIIIVTHNPNIAVVADADQVIVANIDKKTNTFSYKAGALEEKVINQSIVKILEGTEPAFNLRNKKYSIIS